MMMVKSTSGSICKPEKKYLQKTHYAYPFSCSFAPHAAIFIFYNLNYCTTRVSKLKIFIMHDFIFSWCGS